MSSSSWLRAGFLVQRFAMRAIGHTKGWQIASLVSTD